MSKIDVGIEVSMYPEAGRGLYYYKVRDDNDIPGNINLVYVEEGKDRDTIGFSVEEAETFIQLIQHVVKFVKENEGRV